MPPLPAHISREYALHTAEALLKWDPNEWGVIRDSALALTAEELRKVKDAVFRGHGKGQAGDEQNG